MDRHLNATAKASCAGQVATERRKPWVAPAIIKSEIGSNTDKISYPHETIGSICTAICHPTAFGPS